MDCLIVVEFDKEIRVDVVLDETPSIDVEFDKDLFLEIEVGDDC